MMKGKLTLVIILIVVAGLIVWKQTKGTVGTHRTYKATLIDIEAKMLYRGDIPLGTPPPYKSPYSGKKTAYLAFYCPKCNVLFPLIPTSLPTKKEKSPAGIEQRGFGKCPICGSYDVKPYRLSKGSPPIKLMEVAGGKAFTIAGK